MSLARPSKKETSSALGLARSHLIKAHEMLMVGPEASLVDPWLSEEHLLMIEEELGSVLKHLDFARIGLKIRRWTLFPPKKTRPSSTGKMRGSQPRDAGSIPAGRSKKTRA